jgi:ParB family chromosome partitioning protein
LQELAESIRQHGLIQPLILTLSPGSGEAPTYQLVAGERRWRAARLAGLATVPALIKELSSQQMLELALVENLQRTDLSPLEAAAAYRHLMDEFGLTQEQVAARVGKSRVVVANTVRLLSLPEVVKAALNSGQITEGHARALLQLGAPDRQLKALEEIRQRDLTVRQTEELVRRMTEPLIPARKPAPERLSPQWQMVKDRLRTTLNTKVELHRAGKGGRVVIHFYSEEGLDALYQRLVGEEEET